MRKKRPTKPFDQIVRVMARLRSRGGCPWDRKQTHESLLKYLVEESNEFKASVRKRDIPNMEEELGDILLQVIFHARLAQEKGLFTINDVIRTLVRKMTLRHPHVFGYKPIHRRLLKGAPLNTSQQVLDSWDMLKKISARR